MIMFLYGEITGAGPAARQMQVRDEVQHQA
jgi:hypothetical protein